jgi:type IV pilus assembly protein PilC
MLKGMADVLPLPTRMLLSLTGFFQEEWPWILCGAAAAAFGLRAYFRSSAGAVQLDRLKLHVPVLGGIFRASALARFARMLGILLRSGVSLLPALEIVRHTVGNRVLGKLLENVAEEARGGDSLAVPLRKTGMFPATLVQMIAVGEDTGRLDEMLLRVASIEERLMRGQSRTVISLLAPALILVVGAFVGFIVIALLLPIFRMSQSIQ